MGKNKLLEKISSFFKRKSQELDRKLEEKAKETPCCSDKANKKNSSCCS